jgi:DtxR family Mn-dependent transcriptional regulator
MPSQAVEDYLKRLFIEQQQIGDQLVPTGRLATCLGVTPGTATAMVKTLARQGLVHHQPRKGVRLSPDGERHALGVLRRHRIVELFLVKVLGMTWDEVHEEAENLEHTISDAVLTRMDQMLGQPTHDPHGDPIPDADGRMPEATPHSLESCETGHRARVERITDDTPAFLQFLDGQGLHIGVEVEITERSSSDRHLTLQTGTRPARIDFDAARKILISRL